MTDEPSFDPETRAGIAAAELPGHYFDLYKLTVEMADRLSARRGTANSFLLAVNTGVVALVGTQTVRWHLAAAGVVLAVAWWALLKSYRDLNAQKFKTILEMEERLPVRPYGDEWSRLPREKVPLRLRREDLRAWLRQYRELGSVERVVPWVFAAIYVTELVQQFVG